MPLLTMRAICCGWGQALDKNLMIPVDTQYNIFILSDIVYADICLSFYQ